MELEAVLDETGLYRYSLTRIWDETKWRVCFCMLNPSTADSSKDDPTIRKCIGFAQRWGFGSLEVVNLYAYRATDPKDLWKATLPVGAENDRYIREAVQRSNCVVAAWGVNAKCQHRVQQVLRLLGGRGALCLGITKAGAPRHPLYLSYQVETRPYPARVNA